MELNKQVIFFFEKFNKSFQKNDKYAFSELKNTQKNISAFIKKVENKRGKGTIGINFLFEYFAFQFFHYSKPFAIKSKRFLKLGYIISDKALKRYFDAKRYEIDKGIEWAATQKLYISDFQIGLDFQSKPDLFYIEEVERKRFFNTDLGLLHCLQLTSGYTEKSETCLNCKLSVECRQLL